MVHGAVPDMVTPPLPPSAAHGPSGGSFTFISSYVNYTGALGGAKSSSAKLERCPPSRLQMVPVTHTFPGRRS